MAKRTFGQLAIYEPVQNFAGGGETARVDLYGSIGWDVYGDQFLNALKELPESVGDIDLRIHSYGGDVLEGWAIANAIQNHPATVTATIEGVAASMASVIALAADKVEMPKNAYLMIHRLSALAGGNPDEMDNSAKMARQLESDVVNFYAEKTSIPSEEIREMMAAETWMNGEEALAKGFVDKVLEPVKAVALVGERNVVENFGEIPEAIRVANSLGDETPGEAEDAQDPEDEEVGANGEENGESPAGEESGEDAGDAGEVSEEASVSGVLAFVKNLMGGSRDGGAPTSAALTAENARLIAQVETLRADRDAAVMERDRLRESVAEMEREAREVHAVIAECGFSPVDASDLPGPTDDPNDEPPEASILDQFEAMPAGAARKEFFQKNKDAILSAYDKASSE